MKSFFIKTGLGFFLLLMVFLGACNAPIPTANTPQPEPTALQPSASPTPIEEEPSQVEYLTICLGQEPNTLYPYGDPNPAARSVLAALYDGPVDVFLDGYQPVIIEAIPSLQNGDTQIVPVTVQRGDLVLDINDNVVLLDAGVSVFPAGCNDQACVQRYSGTGEIEMDQLVVTFRIKPGSDFIQFFFCQVSHGHFADLDLFFSGATTLPMDLDILRPWPSSTKPCSAGRSVCLRKALAADIA